MNLHDELQLALKSFEDDQLITEVIADMKSGKEASVFLCRGHPCTGVDRLAAKVYRSSDHRSFKNDAAYLAGRFPTKKDQQALVRKRNHKGNVVRFDHWIERELEVLWRLHCAGIAVPCPIERTWAGLAIELVELDGEPAPMLHEVRLDADEARRLFDALIEDVERMLDCECVHGDLSEFNLLYAGDRLVLIDFPQAVDPRFNRHAFELLRRDLRSVCRYFHRYGVTADSELLAMELWDRYMRSA